MNSEQELAAGVVEALIPPADEYEQAAREWLERWYADVVARKDEYTDHLEKSANRYPAAQRDAIMLWWRAEVACINAPPGELAKLQRTAKLLFHRLQIRYGEFDFSHLWVVYEYAHPDDTRYELQKRLHENK